jgi:hypothetical protein
MSIEMAIFDKFKTDSTSLIRLRFIYLNFFLQDNHNWMIQVREFSSINKYITFEVISCEPAALVSSMVFISHTLLPSITYSSKRTYY